MDRLLVKQWKGAFSTQQSAFSLDYTPVRHFVYTTQLLAISYQLSAFSYQLGTLDTFVKQINEKSIQHSVSLWSVKSRMTLDMSAPHPQPLSRR